MQFNSAENVATFYPIAQSKLNQLNQERKERLLADRHYWFRGSASEPTESQAPPAECDDTQIRYDV